MARARCEFFVRNRPYSAPGRCEKRINVLPIVVARVRAKLCSPHRKLVTEGKRPLELAR